MVRYKLFGIISLFIFSFPKFLPFSTQREAPQTSTPLAFPLALESPAKPESPEKKKSKPKPIQVTASVYFPVIAQTDNTPLITADGSRINQKKPRKHRWVAVSRNLLRKWGGTIDYGDSLQVKGISDELDGIYVVHDTMKRRLRNRVDILVGENDDIMGLWPGVEVYQLN